MGVTPRRLRLAAPADHSQLWDLGSRGQAKLTGITPPGPGRSRQARHWQASESLAAARADARIRFVSTRSGRRRGQSLAAVAAAAARLGLCSGRSQAQAAESDTCRGTGRRIQASLKNAAARLPSHSLRPLRDAGRHRASIRLAAASRRVAARPRRLTHSPQPGPQPGSGLVGHCGPGPDRSRLTGSNHRAGPDHGHGHCHVSLAAAPRTGRECSHGPQARPARRRRWKGFTNPGPGRRARETPRCARYAATLLRAGERDGCGAIAGSWELSQMRQCDQMCCGALESGRKE